MTVHKYSSKSYTHTDQYGASLPSPLTTCIFAVKRTPRCCCIANNHSYLSVLHSPPALLPHRALLLPCHSTPRQAVDLYSKAVTTTTYLPYQSSRSVYITPSSVRMNPDSSPFTPSSAAQQFHHTSIRALIASRTFLILLQPHLLTFFMPSSPPSCHSLLASGLELNLGLGHTFLDNDFILFPIIAIMDSSIIDPYLRQPSSTICPSRFQHRYCPSSSKPQTFYEHLHISVFASMACCFCHHGLRTGTIGYLSRWWDNWISSKVGTT